MVSIEFNSVHEAADYRRQNGGWLFVIGETNAWWFDAKCYTPYKILKTAQLKGLSGDLVSDNRYTA